MSNFIKLAKSGNLAAMRDLAAREKINVNFRHPADGGTTALYWSACNGHVIVCDWLLRHGASCNLSTSKSGSLPLHAAADRGRTDCVILLLGSKNNVNAQTSCNGDTALHLAAYRGHLDLCRVLIEHGARTDILNNQGRTALEEAHGMKHSHVFNFLYRTGRNYTTCLLPGNSAQNNGLLEDNWIPIGTQRARTPLNAGRPLSSSNMYHQQPVEQPTNGTVLTPSATRRESRHGEEMTRPFHDVFNLEHDLSRSNHGVCVIDDSRKRQQPSQTPSTSSSVIRRTIPSSVLKETGCQNNDDVIGQLEVKVRQLGRHTQSLRLELVRRDAVLVRLSSENSALRRRAATLDALTRRLEAELEMVDFEVGQQSVRRVKPTDYR